jgi:tRNA(adenine34) deaminase
MDQHEYFMREAIKEAHKAYEIGEVPIGAVVVRQGEIVGRGHNQRETAKRAIAHAEILAIDDACKQLNGWRLIDCDLYVTLEPCLMCGGAIYQSRIINLYYGAKDYKSGAFGSLYNLAEDSRLNHQVQVHAGILEMECSELIKTFFKTLRKK